MWQSAIELILHGLAHRYKCRTKLRILKRIAIIFVISLQKHRNLFLRKLEALPKVGHKEVLNFLVLYNSHSADIYQSKSINSVIVLARRYELFLVFLKVSFEMS